MFTQLSAIVVGCGAMWAALVLVVPLSRVLGFSPGSLVDVPRLPGVLLFLLAMAVVVPAAWYAWKWLLVCVGLLSRREGEGYPYSKPWERR
jgi:hypothetical protein